MGYRKHHFTALALAVALAPPARAADPTSAAVDRVMTDALKSWQVPGAALVVVRGDQTLVLKGYGRKSLATPDAVTPDTLFPLASCSKAFTSALLATLADEGKVNWDDPVRNHLPSFRLADPHADAMVTMRDLLSHRTGLGGHDLLWYRAPWGVDEVLKKIEKMPLDYPFRGGFEYSSLMYMAAGRAAARVTGQAWEKLVRDRLCDPLGMGCYFTTKDIPPLADRTGGHRRGKNGVEAMATYEMPEPNPAGSVHATARDLAAWLKFQIAGGVTGNGRRLVSAQNLIETRTPQNIIRLDGAARRMNPDTTQLSYGLGWVICDHRGKLVVAHGGQIDGGRVQITFLPDEKLGIALLNNLHESRMNQAVTNTLIDMYCNLPPRDWNAFFQKIVTDDEAAKRDALAARDKARMPNTKPSVAAEGFAGEYEHPVWGTAKVVAAGGKLVVEWSSFRCPLEHYQNDEFRITDGHFADELVEFAGPGGKVTAVRFHDVVYRRK
ncbi:MAG TPA: serine hydrolase [Gemmataceae bacterium]|nr:serine hydrolase [Gemmataceae bacterium]